MDNLTPVIRNAVRAVVIRDKKILLLRKDGGGRGERFALPGGAQDLGETLEQALNRECMEEIGTEVTIIDLLHIADFFKARDTDPPSTRHLLEILFACEVPQDYTAQNGIKPDKHQVEVVWVELQKLSQIPLFPASLVHYLTDRNKDKNASYLGLIR